MIYPNEPLSPQRIFNLSLKYFLPAFQQIFPLIIMLVALKALFTYLPIGYLALEVVIVLLIVAVWIFIFTISICRVDSLFLGVPLTWLETWRKTCRVISRVYLACLLVIACSVLIFLLGRWLVFILMGLKGAQAAIGASLIMGIPLILAIIYCYLTLPILAITQLPFFYAFQMSFLYTRQNFLTLLLIYTEAVIILAISSTYTGHSQWLLKHHLMELCDLVVFFLLIPLMINQTLLLLNSQPEVRQRY